MATPLQKPLLLVDGSSYLFRAYHGLPPLTTSDGVPVGAMYGVITMLRKLLTDYAPDHVAIIFDTKVKTFRHHLYSAYKANRTEMPQELSVQIKPLHDIIKAMGLPLLAVEGVEADDVIGTLAIKAAAQGMHTVVSTGDKDMAQLVCEQITLVNTMSNQILDCAGVIEKFGVAPEKIIDYLSLVGDTSDNIPGVMGIGPKTAVKLLQEYGSLDRIVSEAANIKGKLGENLREAIKDLPLYKTLVTIKHDVDLNFDLNDLQLKKPDAAQLITYFTQFEFKKLLQELQTTAPLSAKSTKNYTTILNQKEFDAWITRLNNSNIFAFDTETTDLDAMNAKLVGLSFAINAHEAAYVPLAHDYEGAPTQLDLNTVLQALKPLLEDPTKKIIGQNTKYDAKVLKKYNINLSTQGFDTMLESYVLNSTLRHDLDSMAEKHLQYKTIHYEDVAGKGAKQIGFNQVSIDKATDYAAEDADITLQLHQTLFPQVAEQEKLLSVFETIEMPLIDVLVQVESTGVMIDEIRLKEQGITIAKELEVVEQQAFELADAEFNLNSPKQLQDILYKNLKLPILKKTPTGQPSTAEPVLEELALNYPLPKLILRFRSLSKLKSTYIDALPEQINAQTGRVHTSYHQANTATGRLSSSNPNLQNIPVKTEEGRRIRQAFIVPRGYKMLAADYSQIELRIMAHLAHDEGLKKAFIHGLDIHKATAAEVFNTPLEKISNEQRRSAKAINFGLIYGMSAFGLAQQLGTDRHAAQRYIDLYFARYPSVKKYMDMTVELARKQGYVETLFGRRLYLSEINVDNISRQRGAERAAINAPLQGTAADIIKRAMISIHHFLKQNSIDARMLMQVHDELVFEVAEKDVAVLKENVEKFMIAASPLSVPMVIDIGIGDNWDEAH